MGYLGLALSRRPLLGYAIFTLACVPWGILGLNQGHLYQFYKVLLSVSPLFPLGAVILAAEIERLPFNKEAATLGKRHCLRLMYTFMVLMFTASSISTLHMAYASGTTRKYKLYSTASRHIQDKLGQLHDQDVFIDYEEDHSSGAYMRGWLVYFARHNRVYIDHPDISDIPLPGWRLMPQQLPRQLYVLISSDVYPVPVMGEGLSVVFNELPYILFKARSPDWALVKAIHSGNVGQLDTKILALGRQTIIEMLSGKAGRIKFSAHVGPLVVPSPFSVQVSVDSQHWQKTINNVQRSFTIVVPVQSGRNIIRLQMPETAVAVASPGTNPGKGESLKLECLALKGFE